MPRRNNHSSGRGNSGKATTCFQTVSGSASTSTAEFTSSTGGAGDPTCSSPMMAGMANNITQKSTRLNSSHDQISYAVFCLKKKKKQNRSDQLRNVIIF